MQLLTVSGIGKEENGTTVLQDIHFTQHKGQQVAIAGETGSGKSTLLKIIAGLVQPTAGEVLLDGKRVKGPDEKLIPGHPAIGYLSQHFELRNHYRVSEELSYTNLLPEAEAAAIYELCHITHLLNRWTMQLSGGERQRIVLARLLVATPGLLLLDEPFSNLDPIHKSILKKVIHDIGEQLQISCIMVSHDPLDTLSWADNLIVLKEGKVIQSGAPQAVYQTPTNEYVAGLLGAYQLLPPAQAQRLGMLDAVEREPKKLLVRPEQFVVSNNSIGVKGIVQKVSFFGSFYRMDVAVEGESVQVQTDGNRFTDGDEVYVSLLPIQPVYI